MTPLLSIIVPIYNVEKYLNSCIDSILMQTMSDYEVILVDDGSPDNCGMICDSYAEKHENVYAFHKENGGLSDARNFGIQNARGEYLLFIDSDDYYDDCEFFNKIQDAIFKYNYPTIINFSNKRLNMSTGEVTEGKYSQEMAKVNSEISYEELLKYLIENDSLAISACFKAIKRSYIIENGLYFKKGIFSEDIEWSMRVYSKQLNMKFVDSSAYIYRSGRSGSITNSMNKKNLMDLVDIIDEYSTIFLKSQSLLSDILLNYLAYQYSILCGLISRIQNKQDKKLIFEFVKKNKWILDFSLSAKVKNVSKLCKFIGIRNTVLVLGFYINNRGH